MTAHARRFLAIAERIRQAHESGRRVITHMELGCCIKTWNRAVRALGLVPARAKVDFIKLPENLRAPMPVEHLTEWQKLQRKIRRAARSGLIP